MLITEGDFQTTYESVKNNAFKYGGTILILTAPDADAIAAARIVTELFRSDNMSYEVIPVNGYVETQEHVRRLMENDDTFRTIFMINCGGIVAITDFFGLSQEASRIQVYICDSHRPLNLENIHDDNVFVFEEVDIDKDAIPSIDDLLHFNLLREEDADEYDDLNPRAAQRRRADDGSPIDERPTWQLKQDAKRRVEEYYQQGTFHAKSAACHMFRLASQLSKDHNQQLWWAIVGLTDQYVHERIDTEKYNAELAELHDEVFRRNPDDAGTTMGDDGALIPIAQEGRISMINEFRFMLVRHWSVFDAMNYSTYVAARMASWKEQGRRRMEMLLAKIGLPLKEAKQHFSFMSAEAKRTFREKLVEEAQNFGLEDVTYVSFQYSYGFKDEVSAADMVYAATALLEAPAPDLVAGREDIAALSDTPDQRFWKAYDCMGEKNLDLLKKGLLLSTSFQRAIAQQGIALIEKKLIKTIPGNMRYVFIESGAELPFFLHPLTLSKLALFLVDALRERAKTRTRVILPLIVAALNERTGTYLVVGVTGTPRFGSVDKNPFGLAFTNAIEQTAAQVKHDSFETSVLEIRKEDLSRFVDSLQEVFDYTG